MIEMLREVARRLRQSLSDLLYRLLSPRPAAPSSLAFEIKLKFGEAQLVQDLLLRCVKSTQSLILNEVNYSLLGSSGIDGALLFLFGRGGFTNRVAVDIGAGDCICGNTANLILFHQFRGYMLDGSRSSLQAGELAHRMIGRASLPTFIHATLTSANASDVLARHGVPDLIDLLSIDIDSIDLYVVENLKVRARVIVLEFNNLWGPAESFSVPNVDGFQRELDEFLYGGASLAAFHKILSSMGYKLVGIAKSGFDAFFVLNSPEFESIPERSIESLYDETLAWQVSYQLSIVHPVRLKKWVAI